MQNLPVCLVLAGASVLAGCQAMLDNWPIVQQFPERGVVARAEGIRMAARTGVWEGIPADLAQRMTPVHVTISNESTRPVTIRHHRFQLVTDEGRRYLALAPFQLDESVGTAGNPYYLRSELDDVTNRSYFPGATMHGGPVVWNTPYWNRFSPELGSAVPTEEMVRKALPQGVLQPGARVSGFLYFEGVGRDVERVHLRADFEETTGNQVSHLTLPLGPN